MNSEVQEIQKTEDVEKFHILFKAHYLPNVGKKERLKEGQTGNSSETIAETKEFNFCDTKHNYVFKIKQLDFSCCDLSQIPKEICQFKYLTTINLKDNLLESLPEDIGNLYNLVTLQLSGNKLSCLPKSLRYIQQLNCLDISHNNFLEVPDVLYYGLRGLKFLNLSHNKISKFNDPPVCINELVSLILSHNALMQLPVWIFDSICHLQIFDVSENQISFHCELVNVYGTGIFQSLQLLNIENCNYNISNMQVLCDFENLEVLYMGNKTNAKRTSQNYFGNFKMNIFKNLLRIKYLYLQNVQIATLPSDFDCLKNINILDLCNNLLSWLPECFCNLISLRVLYLTSNQLFFLPKNIGYLVNLEQIHLGNNKLYKIPESFYNLANLEYVDFYNNKIENIDKKIFEGKYLKGIDLGLNYVNFSFISKDGDLDEIRNFYDCLKMSFRKSFGLLDCRSDAQMTSLHKAPDGLGSEPQAIGSRCSSSSYESEQYSDNEDLPATNNTSCRNDPEDEDWEKSPCDVESDELFDPNEDTACQPAQSLWSSEFQKNYCPAKYHVPSVKKVFVKNFKSALKKEIVEGQFDSD